MTDKKYEAGYAPGNYWAKCSTCGKEFQGAKMAFQCEPCADASTEWYNNLTPEQREEHHKKFREAYDKIVAESNRLNNQQKQ